MNLRATDAVVLGPNGKLQEGVQCFSLDAGKILQRAWNNVALGK